MPKDNNRARIIAIDDLKSSVTKDALAFWEEARDGAALAPAAAINPARFKHLLPHVVLIEAAWEEDAGRPSDFIYRVVGEHSTQAHGAALIGTRVSDLSRFGEAYATSMLAFYRRICAEKAAVAAAGTLKMIGKDYRRFEAVYLPFSKDGDRVDRIFCAVVYE